MPDLVMVPATVLSAANAVVQGGIAGETIAAGNAVYKKSTDSKIYKAQCDGTPEEASVVGIAINGASLNQPVNYQSGGELTLGGTTTVKTTMYVLSGAFGGICPQADLIATNRIVYMGYAKDLVGGFVMLRANTGVVV